MDYALEPALPALGDHEAVEFEGECARIMSEFAFREVPLGRLDLVAGVGEMGQVNDLEVVHATHLADLAESVNQRSMFDEPRLSA